MSTAVTDYTASAAITITMNNLGDGNYYQGAVVDNSAFKYIDAYLSGQVQVGTTPTDGTTIEFWGYAELDTVNGTYLGDCTGTNTTYSPNGSEDELVFLTSITVDTTTDQYYPFYVGSVAAAFGGVLPRKWGIVIRNRTGATTNATGTNNRVYYGGVKYVSS